MSEPYWKKYVVLALLGLTVPLSVAPVDVTLLAGSVVTVAGTNVSIATYVVVVDALTHDGPAVLSRLPRSSCGRLIMPGVTDPAAANALLPSLYGAIGTLAIAPGPLPNPIVKAPILHTEPAVPCYAFETCEPPDEAAESEPAAEPVQATQPVSADDGSDDVATDVSTNAPLLSGVLGTATGLLGPRH